MSVNVDFDKICQDMTSVYFSFENLCSYNKYISGNLGSYEQFSPVTLYIRESYIIYSTSNNKIISKRYKHHLKKKHHFDPCLLNVYLNVKYYIILFVRIIPCYSHVLHINFLICILWRMNNYVMLLNYLKLALNSYIC